jgi:hypothetical protein
VEARKRQASAVIDGDAQFWEGRRRTGGGPEADAQAQRLAEYAAGDAALAPTAADRAAVLEAYERGRQVERDRLAAAHLARKRSRQQQVSLVGEIKRERERAAQESKDEPKRGSAVAPLKAVLPKQHKTRAAEEREARAKAADDRWKARFLKDAKRDQWAAIDAEPPPCIPRDVWLMCWQIVGDPTGRGARMWLRWLRRRYGGWVLSRLREAAMMPDAEGRARYTWADERARRICALGLLLLRMSHETTRRQAWGSVSTIRGRLVKGLSAEALCSALAAPWDLEQRPSAKNIGATVGDWTGYIAALDVAGFLERGQVPIEVANSFEVGRYSGKTINRYWVPDPLLQAQPQPGMGTGIRHAPLDDTTDANRVGWDWCDEVLERAPCRAERRAIALLAVIMGLVPP